MTIRKMQGSDLPDALKLIQLMHAESPTYKIYPYSKNNTSKILERSLIDLNMLCLIAESSGNKVGMFLGYITPMFFSESRQATDLLCYVLPGFRGHKFAYEMIVQYKEWARTAKVDAIRLGVTAGIKNEKVVSFYKKMGFREFGTFLEYK